MATFKALNIESDDEEDIEVDDTKEIQIEEALKLYQTALKFHSEGPASYDQAAEAYRALFDSDIFKYPESQQELKRFELYGPQPDQDDFYLEHEDHVVSGENAPSTLPQIIHLSYKNHGEFLLQSLQYKLLHSGAHVQVNTQEIAKASAAALNCFVEAIDKDDSDLDLWRRTAAVGEMLDSHRIARFCLEAVLDGDDQSLDAVLSMPGISETLAGQQLRELVAKLEDQLSLLQSPLSTMKRRQLSGILKQKLATYATVKAYQSQHPLPPPSSGQPLRSVLKHPKTWHELGDILERHVQNELHGATPNLPGLGVSFQHDDGPVDVDVIPVDQPSPRHISPQPPEMSSHVEAQFPGMDNGQPSIPVPAFQDAEMTKSASEAPSTTTLPTRKRSSDAAGLRDADAADGGRSKSKRIRARESLVDQSTLEDDTIVDTQQAENDLADLDYVDNQMFEALDELFAKIDFPKFAVSPNVRKDVRDAAASTDVQVDGVELACLDMFTFLNRYSNDQARLLLLANSDLDSTSEPQAKPSGRFSAAPPAHSRENARPELDQHDGLEEFISKINSDFLHINDVVMAWIIAFLSPLTGSYEQPLGISSYLGNTWSQDFKALMVRILLQMDPFIFELSANKIRKWDKALLQKVDVKPLNELLGFIELIQTLFEMHVDVYSLVKEPNSGIDWKTIIDQGDRADRWGNLARDAMNLRSSILQRPSLKDELNLRYLWAATHHISIINEISQEHVIACWAELRSIFSAVGEPVIDLPNNSIMPQMSIEAIDRELARLTTQDFFSKVFESEHDDLTVVIESLEPLLEALHGQILPNNGEEFSGSNAEDNVDYASLESSELLNFLKNSNIAMQVRLWQRLREAYEGIEYQPMVICCYFRVIELLLADIKSSAYSERSLSERQSTLLKYVRLINDLIGKIVHATSLHTDALDCMDLDRLHSAMGCMVELHKMLHASTMLQDDIKVGIKQTPSGNNGLPLPSFPAVVDVLQEMQLNSWTLMYKLFKESLAQNKEKVERVNGCLFEFLSTVHQALGARSLCGKANRIFLKLAKTEVLRFRNEAEQQNDDYDLEFAQILYDLFGLKCFLNPSYALKEHNCMHDAFVDKTSAMQAVDLLLNLASRIKMTDLPKHSLNETIEKVHGIITRKKPSDAILRNRDVYRAFLKSHINPINLYKSLRGEGELLLSPVPPEQAILASKGWYFLMGHIALSKFRAQRRLGPAATEDVDIAVAFFMQDLEYSMENWQTWFRLAQAYDSKIEEAVSWSADKVNNNMPELVQQQRAAIHCYTMAVALAMRSAEPGPETQAKLGELYADFAMRIYASTREPFGMKAFLTEDLERFLSRQTIIKVPPFKAMDNFHAWRFARELFRRAIKINPNKWQLHFYLGKCLWKMFRNSQFKHYHDKQPNAHAVIQEFIESINLLPRKKDSRREPILEPHYKLVVVVHKMVTEIDDSIGPAEGCDILKSATPYAAKIDPVIDDRDWEQYILKVLKSLRAADKVHWHHRMIYRTAEIAYNGGISKAHCIAAKHELMQQMFTKTMMMNVWKPENERPGRHFVYTTRYADMFIKILETLEDRASLDALARRIRKKPAEFFEHGALWQCLCTAYLKVLRQHGQVPLAQETAIFSGINHEDFLRRKDYLQNWCQDPANANNPLIETLHEVIELKKINGTLMKAAPIDDLIGDTYAYLYDTIGRKLWTAQEAKDEEKKNQETAKAAEAATPTPSQERSSVMNLSHLMNLDSAGDTTPKPPTPALFAAKTVEGTDTPPTTDAAPAQSRRKIGVGRREVRLCAEACVSKIGSSGATPSTGEPTRTRQEVAVVIETRRPTPKTAGADAAEGSVVGSGADDADDESDSELSDVDEDLVNKGQPPGLSQALSKTVSAMAAYPGVKQSDVVSDSEDEDVGLEGDEVIEEHEGEEEGDGDAEDGEEEEEGDEADEGDGEDEEGEPHATAPNPAARPAVWTWNNRLAPGQDLTMEDAAEHGG